jgi:hypothetical protein
MIYCMVIGTLAALAAHLVEQVVLDRGGSTRRVWVLAMTAAVALPAAVLVPDGRAAAPLDGGIGDMSVGMLVVTGGVDFLSAFDGPLLWAWGLTSAALALLLVGSLVAVARRGRAWARAEIDGVPVLVSDDVGPAVVGVVRSRIVLPRWVVAEDAMRRALLLRHEQEHVAAGDARLILLAALLVAAMPWNVALWRLATRLRMAVETDCDRRVLGCPGVDARSYGALLLAVGRRRSARAAMATIGFSRPRSLLEVRIDRMTRRRRQGMLHIAATGGAVLAILAAAWSLPRPVLADEVANAVAPCPQDAGGSAAAAQVRKL